MQIRRWGWGLVVLATVGCANTEEKEAADLDVRDAEQLMIYYGSPPDSPEHDATVALHEDWGWWTSGVFCTGTLIFDDWVLTAAHCVQGMAAKDILVNFGTNSSQMGSNTYDVSQVITHSGYSSWSNTNDIALLKLKSSAASEADPVMPLPSSLGLGSSDEGDDLNIAGFGDQETGAWGTLEQVDVEITDVRSKEVEYDQGNGWGNGDGGPCTGDSGGPAFIKRSGKTYVAGVTSYGDFRCNNYGVSTRVDAFESWIESNTGWSVETSQGGGSGGSTGGSTGSGAAVTVAGNLSGVGDMDVWSYIAGATGEHQVTLSAGGSTDFDLCLMRWNGWDYEVVDKSTLWYTSGESIAYSASASGEYLAIVYSYDGSGDYTLDVTFPN